MVQFVPGRVDDYPTELYINITGKLAILNKYHPLKSLRFQVVCYQRERGLISALSTECCIVCWRKRHGPPFRVVRAQVAPINIT